LKDKFPPELRPSVTLGEGAGGRIEYFEAEQEICIHGRACYRQTVLEGWLDVNERVVDIYGAGLSFSRW
jgi:hypothetical protein